MRSKVDARELELRFGGRELRLLLARVQLAPARRLA